MYYSRRWNISAVGLALWLTAAPGYAQQSKTDHVAARRESDVNADESRRVLDESPALQCQGGHEYDVIQVSPVEKLEFGVTRVIRKSIASLNLMLMNCFS